MADVVCLGEALIDFVALESGVGVGEASGFVRAPGGAPANVAVGVARLGGTSAFLGKVGDDPFGRFLEQTFSEAGVDTGGMVFDSTYRTGLAFVSLQSNGERDFCFFRNPSADMRYTPEELDRARIAAGRIFHFGSITLVERLSRKTTLAAVEVARAAGLLISYDPNLRPPLWPDLKSARNTILKAAHFADIVKVSAEELVFLMGATAALPEHAPSAGETLSALLRFARRFPNIRLLVATRGEQGCVWHGRQGGGFSPGIAVDTVDTTGAGDGFVAGLLVGLLAQNVVTTQDLEAIGPIALTSILGEANVVGALTTTRKGAIPALPTAAQVAHFMKVKTV